MRAAWMTDKGRIKSVNEDALLVDEAAGLFLLADGMSAPRAGRVASRLAVRKAHAFLKERLPQTVDAGVPALLNESVAFAHREVQKASLKRRLLSGMGTTLIVLCIRDDIAYLSHVGDSRAYRQRDRLELITRDHTLEYRLDHDVMLRELFFFHKARVLSQAIGPSRKVACDGHRVDLRQGDVILLCTDGLTDMLSDKAMEALIECHRDDPGKTAEVLVEAANRRGGRDNITVVLVAP